MMRDFLFLHGIWELADAAVPFICSWLFVRGEREQMQERVAWTYQT
jgi:hypothetical protein